MRSSRNLAGSPHQNTILVVDDNLANLEVIAEYLTKAGFQIMTARNGEAGLALIQRHPPSLILLDVMMPGIDGFETCRRLKADETTREIPVIFMTVADSTEDKVKGLAVGGVDYIIKPFQAEEVLARCQTHLTLYQLQQDLRELNRTLEDRVTARTADLVKVNRAYRALSNGNQALLYATREDELLDKMCQIIQQDCGYRFIWIGFAEQDEAKTVRPVAHAGYEAGYLEAAKITWADNALGQGPAGIAIRSGQFHISKDIQSDPLFTPWREEALRRGYATCIALPLRGDNAVFGVLSIYSVERDAFQTEEIDLLMEMASDLAFGLTSLRERVERKRAEESLRESEQRFRAIFEFAPVGVCLLNVDGRFLQVNEALCQMLGYSSEVLEQMGVADITYPDDLEVRAASLESVMYGITEQASFDRRYVHKDGHAIWVQTSSALIRDSRQQPVYVISHIQDISERKQMEDAIRAARDELEQRVLDRTTDLKWANDLLTQEITEREKAQAAEKEQRILAEALIDTATALNSTLDLEEVLDQILVNLGRVIKHPSGAIMLIEDDESRLVRWHGYKDYVPDEVLRSIRMRIDETASLRQMLETGQPLIIPDTHQFEGWIVQDGRDWIRSYAAAPILAGQKVIGFINLDSPEPNEFKLLDTQRLRAFADQAAIAIENARLYEHAQALAALEERNRIAQDLHDVVSQTLWSANLIAEVLPSVWDKDRAEGELGIQQLQHLTRGALAELRTLLWELRPAGLTEVTLSDLIQQLTQVHTGRTGVPIDLNMQGQYLLAPHIQVTLYRLAQEALNNVARHSAATRVTVSLECQPRKVMLHIGDNGTGFNLDSVPVGHLGLGIMHERAQTINAVLKIDSKIGQGTQVDITWAAD